MYLLISVNVSNFFLRRKHSLTFRNVLMCWPNIILSVLVFCQESTSSDITQIGWVKIGGGPTIIFLLLSAPRFCHRWGHNYRHWWNHGGGAHVRESGLFVQLGSDITPPPLESGVRDEIRHQGEQLHVVQVDALQPLCNYRGEGNWCGE